MINVFDAVNSMSPENTIPSGDECVEFFRQQGVQQKHFVTCETYGCLAITRITNWKTYKHPSNCPRCNKNMIKINGKTKNIASLFDIGQQLQRLYYYEDTANLLRKHSEHVPEECVIKSVYDGKIYKKLRELLGPDNRHIILNISIDGLSIKIYFA